MFTLCGDAGTTLRDVIMLSLFSPGILLLDQYQWRIQEVKRGVALKEKKERKNNFVHLSAFDEHNSTQAFPSTCFLCVQYDEERISAVGLISPGQSVNFRIAC